MNLLFLDQFSDPGGAQFCLRDLLPEVLRRRWSAQIMVPGSGELVKWSNGLGVPTRALPLRSYSNGRKTPFDLLRFSVDGPRIAAAVQRFVKQERADLIYVNGPRIMPAMLGMPCPIIFHAHSCVPAGCGRKLLECTLRSTNATVIAASKYVADTYPTISSERVKVIYNGVEDFERLPRNFERQCFRVGILGRIAPEKGQMDFVRAASRMADGQGQAEFFVYGEKLFADSGYDARVRSLAGNLPIRFCGWSHDVAETLHSLDILAVPSGPHEAAARVIMEAFSAGTPVVAYRSGGIPELVENGRTGVLTDAPDAGSLAHSIRALMQDRQSMARFAAAGRQEWQRRFRIERFRRDVCDLLESYSQSTRRKHCV